MNDIIILALMLQGPRYGYQLKREAGVILGQAALHNNIVYPLLRRFLKDDWVSRKEVPGQRGQTRQQYAITALGRRALLDRLKTFSDADAASESAFRMRVGFFELLEPDMREEILLRRERYLSKRIVRLSEIERTMKLRKYGSEVILYLCQQVAHEMDWISRLRRLAKTPARRKL